MKGNLIEINNRTWEILRIVLLGSRKIATVQFFDTSRKRIDLTEYTLDEEKKVWKKT